MIEVPANWKSQENYLKFSNYQIKYYIEIGDKKNVLTLTAKVYDSSHMYRTPITTDMLTESEGIQTKTKGASIRSESKEIIKINGSVIGLYKYTFLNTKRSKCYGVIGK